MPIGNFIKYSENIQSKEWFSKIHKYKCLKSMCHNGCEFKLFTRPPFCKSIWQ